MGGMVLRRDGQGRAVVPWRSVSEKIRKEENLMRKVLAVCDTEREYAVRFMNYLTEKQNLPFEIRSFTSVETLREFALEHHIEILLISERAADDEIRQMDIGTVMILTEDGSGLPEEGFPEAANCRQIYKYQSQSRVVREVMDCYGAEKAAMEPEVIAKPSCVRTGICSVSDPGQKVIFSMIYGRILSEKFPSLYLNLEPGSGMDQFLPEKGESMRTLSDLMYFYRRGRSGLIYQLNTMLRKFGSLDYLLPVRDASDIGEMTEDQWTGMLGELTRTSTYRRILLDLDWKMNGFNELIQGCEEIYVIAHDDPVSRMRNRAFAAELEVRAGREKIREVILPDPDCVPGNDDFLERQLSGRLGRIIRGCVDFGEIPEEGKQCGARRSLREYGPV